MYREVHLEPAREVGRELLLLDQFESLDLQTLSTEIKYYLNPTCLRIPPSVTQLELNVGSNPLIDSFAALLEILALVGSQLKVLGTRIRPCRDTDFERNSRTIRLPLLQLLTIGDAVITLTNFLHEVDCPNLREVCLVPPGDGLTVDNGSPLSIPPRLPISPRVSETNPVVHLSKLKHLSIDAEHWGDMLHPLLTLYIPSLESLSFNSPGPVPTSQPYPAPKNPSSQTRLRSMPIRSLNFRAFHETITGDSLALLEFLNLHDVQHLRVELESSTCSTDSAISSISKLFKPSMPLLRCLEVTANSQAILIALLNHFNVGHSISTLHLRLTLSCNEYWYLDFDDSTADDRMVLDSKFHQITTLVIPVDGEHIARMFPALTSLVLTSFELDTPPSTTSIIWPMLYEFDPGSSDQSISSIDCPVNPKLQDITVELSGQYALDTVLRSWSKMRDVVLEVNAHRRALGVVPLETITFCILAPDFATPEVELLPTGLHDDIIFRIRHSAWEQRPSALLSEFL